MKVFAHRGVSALYPENSQTALSACKDQGIYGLEIDVFQTKDDFLIVHDTWLSRLFGINKKVTELDSKQTAELICPDGKSIPNLEWLIREFAEQKLMLNIELKTIQGPDTFIAELNRLVNRYNFDPECLLISSFNHSYLNHIHQHQPDWKLGLLIAHLPISIEPYLELMPLHSIHLCIDAISTELLQALQQKAIAVYVYTVDQKPDIEFLYQHQVAGIFANHPEQAHKIINNLI